VCLSLHLQPSLIFPDKACRLHLELSPVMGCPRVSSILVPRHLNRVKVPDSD
jgi:hypothetical protein